MSFEYLKVQEIEQVNTRVEELLDERFHKYELVRKDFEQYFNGKGLSDELKKKANVLLVQEICDKKANNTELAETNALIESLNYRVKHISTL